MLRKILPLILYGFIATCTELHAKSHYYESVSTSNERDSLCNEVASHPYQHSLGIVLRANKVSDYSLQGKVGINLFYKAKVRITDDYGLDMAFEYGPFFPSTNPQMTVVALRLFVQPDNFPIYPIAGFVFQKYFSERVGESKALIVNSQTLKEMFHYSFGICAEISQYSGFLFVDFPVTKIVRHYISQELSGHYFFGGGFLYRL